MLLPENNQRVHGDADHDGWHAVQYIGREAYQVAEPVASVFRQIDSTANAQGNSYNAGHGQD